jgi:hypothetical protein
MALVNTGSGRPNPGCRVPDFYSGHISRTVVSVNSEDHERQQMIFGERRHEEGDLVSRLDVVGLCGASVRSRAWAHI